MHRVRQSFLRVLLLDLGIVFLAILIAVFVRKFLLGALETRIPWVAFYPAVVIASLYGGWLTGLMSAVSACLVTLYAWPLYADQPFIIDDGDQFGMFAFLFNCVIILTVVEAVRRSHTPAIQIKVRQLEQTNRELERELAERERTETMLAESEQRMRRFYESGMIGVLYWNMNGQVVDANDKFLEIVGYGREDLGNGRINWGELTPPEYRKRDEEAIAELKATGVMKTSFEKEYIRKDGRRAPVEVAGAMIDKERVNGVAFVLDITGRKRAETQVRQLNAELEYRVVERTAQLEAANKEMESFSYSVSHDLRAPLRTIDGYAAILLEDYASGLDAEGKRVCDVIREGTRKMGALIDALLSFSRFGRAEILSLPVDMETMARSTFLEVTTPLSRGRINFHVDPLPPAVGDSVLIRQVWTNLLSNAVKFSSKKDRAVIEVGCAAVDESGVVSADSVSPNPGAGRPQPPITRKPETVFFIRDNGVGFNMQFADKLFGVFHRLPGANEFEGTGVGLAIVHRIIQRHGGRLWADAEAGKGATFYFTLRA